MMAQAGGGETEAVVDLLPRLVDHVHAVGGVLLSTHGASGIVRGVRLVETRLALVKTLFNFHGLSVFVIVHNEHIFALNVGSFLGIHRGFSVVTGSSFFHQFGVWTEPS